MYHQMENAFAHVEVDELGAQLHSLRRRKDGYEYLWQGDPAIWPGQAPILFPIVGSLAEERYWLGGQPYQMPRHGFARRKRFFCVDESNDRLVFSLTDDVETRAQYPFAFELRVTYLLTGQKLGVTHTVLNPAAEPLYFSLGAHPAFAAKLGIRSALSAVRKTCIPSVSGRMAYAPASYLLCLAMAVKLKLQRSSSFMMR